jgi:sugar phosphate isomerase/epimerase
MEEKMNESWKRYMKLGLIHFMAYPQVMKGEGPILETLEKILCDEFFDVVEVTTMKDPAVRAKAANMIAASKVTVAYGAQPVQLVNKLDLNCFDAEERARVVGICKCCVDEAYELGAVGIGFLSGPDPGEAKKAGAMDLLCDSLDKICSYAASKGKIKVALETFDGTVDKKALIGSNADAARLSECLRQKHPHFGLMLDLSHSPIQFEPTCQALYAAKDHLIHAHMGNCILKDKNQPGYGDAHPRFGIPGGENDVPELAEYLKVLLEIGYLSKERRPILSFEVKPMPEESSEIVIANAKRTFVEAWGSI